MNVGEWGSFFSSFGTLCGTSYYHIYCRCIQVDMIIGGVKVSEKPSEESSEEILLT
jgi:hypothetical protein